MTSSQRPRPRSRARRAARGLAAASPTCDTAPTGVASSAATSGPAEDRPVVRASGVGDLIGALPHLLGHVPAHSLVVIGLRGPRERIGICARVDLPPDPWAGHQGLASQLVGPLLRDGCDGAVVVAVSDEEWGGRERLDRERPWARLVRDVRATFGQAGIDVADAVHTDLSRWWSYDCSQSCCPVEGVEVDPCSPLSTALVAQGSAPSASREAIGAVLEPPPAADVAEATAAAQRRADEVPDGTALPGESATQARGEAVARVLGAVLDQALGRSLPPPGVAGELAASLTDVVVRDATLALLCDDLAAALASGAFEAVDDDLQDGSGVTVAALVVAERALRGEVAALVRVYGTEGAGLGAAEGVDVVPAPPLTPPLVPWLPEAVRPVVHAAAEVVLGRLAATVEGPLAAPVAGSLAYLAWRRGRGVLAQMAVDRALLADPVHSMALLVARALEYAVPPPFAVADSTRDWAVD